MAPSTWAAGEKSWIGLSQYGDLGREREPLSLEP
jgi:hypothetical protein